ncbi:sulfur carrier protein ThiS [Frigidibacter sp. MR17.24]|uniref:sulfur carrier protein ThiS n=1 Tax=Frigidibacter sp. MR17.24 TaxID=3127345 RepID=UPI003012AAFC
MKVFLNGEALEFDGATLAEALAAAGYGEARVATAVNEEFVPAGARAATPLSPGDRIEVVTARQGG